MVLNLFVADWLFSISCSSLLQAHDSQKQKKLATFLHMPNFFSSSLYLGVLAATVTILESPLDRDLLTGERRI